VIIDGEAGAVWAMQGQVRAAFMFTIACPMRVSHAHSE
jgi:hypothetical protein